MEKILQEEGVILRHSLVERLEHWVLALSGFILVFSGFGELPMYKRYMVTEIPGLSWAGDYYINLKIHYLAAIVFISVMVFHALYHGWLGHRGLLPRKGDVRDSAKTILSMFGFGEEPKADKYLPEQRLAYVYLAGIGLVLVITGIFKVLKNLPGVYFFPWFVTAVTLIHTFATIFFLLGILAHVAALVFKVNRPMVKPIFTGKMDLEYARNRHPIWYERLGGRPPAAEEGIAAPATRAEEMEEKKETIQVAEVSTPPASGGESAGPAATEEKQKKA
jgi:formate dehydrogenase gamma subunit